MPFDPFGRKKKAEEEKARQEAQKKASEPTPEDYRIRDIELKRRFDHAVAVYTTAQNATETRYAKVKELKNTPETYEKMQIILSLVDQERAAWEASIIAWKDYFNYWLPFSGGREPTAEQQVYRKHAVQAYQQAQDEISGAAADRRLDAYLKSLE